MGVDGTERDEKPGDAAQTDEVFWVLHGLRTELVFINEYRAQFEALREPNPERAEDMLFHLSGTTHTALDLFNELVELLLAGKTLALGKPLPRELRLTRRNTRPTHDDGPP